MHYIRDLANFVRRHGLGGRGVIVGTDPNGRGGTAFPCVPPGAAGVEKDDSLDVVCVNWDAPPILFQRALEAWWPKLRTGGVLVGSGYCDRKQGEAGAGFRSCADEFAAGHNLSLRLTLDKIPAWYAVKGEVKSLERSLKIGLVTAYDGAEAELAAVSSPNKRAYCLRHGYDLIDRTGGFDLRRHPVWGKVKFLRELLPRYDWLFWSDADSLVMRPEVPLETFLPDDRDSAPPDVVIGLEDLGVGVFHVNAGQFFVRNGRWSVKFLEDWYGVEHFEGDALREQRALIHLIESRDLSRRVRLVPQRRFNSYPCNYQCGDFLLHFPDLPVGAKVRLMRASAANDWEWLRRRTEGNVSVAPEELVARGNNPVG